MTVGSCVGLMTGFEAASDWLRDTQHLGLDCYYFISFLIGVLFLSYFYYCEVILFVFCILVLSLSFHLLFVEDLIVDPPFLVLLKIYNFWIGDLLLFCQIHDLLAWSEYFILPKVRFVV